MGDSEAVAAEESNLMEYPSKNFASTDYYESSLNVAADTSAAVSDSVGASIGDPAHASYAVNCPIAYGGDPNAVVQASQINASYDGVQLPSVADTNQVAAGLGSTGMDASQVVGYSSAVNGSVTGVTTSTGVDNGIISGNGDGSVGETQAADGLALPMSAEEDRLWNIVRANSLDFTAWTSLIEETEKVAESNILKIRKVYDTFLAEFPLCYGYWKKYADHEARLSSIEKVVEVYERAVQGVTYSVDIWLHYCIFAIATYDDPDTVRRLFERGLAYVGSDYLSFTLWDKYIEYECMYAEWGRLAMIYTRILENPNQQLDRYFNSFKELAASRPLSELRSADEAAAAASNASDTLTTNAKSDAGCHSNEEEAGPGTTEHAKSVSVGLTEAEELEKYIAVREEMYKKAKEFDSKIIGFETAIRRPYFHVRPLNVVELENWHNYLDFMEKEGDFSKQLFNGEIELRLKHGPWIYILRISTSIP